MEYSQLVNAIKKGDRAQTSRVLNKLTPHLISFLRIHMNAEVQDAEDSVQQTLMTSVETIREDKIRDADSIFSFLLTTCRNNYLNLVKENNRNAYEDVRDYTDQKPKQLSSLLEKERQSLLKRCMDQLSEKYRTFIEYWFSHPDSNTQAASNRFNMTINNAWTLKHRVIKKLNECYQKKI